MVPRPLNTRFFALEVVAAAVLLPGALTMPVLAASPVITDQCRLGHRNRHEAGRCEHADSRRQ